MTFSITHTAYTQKKNDTQYNNTQHNNALMLSVVFLTDTFTEYQVLFDIDKLNVIMINVVVLIVMAPFGVHPLLVKTT